MSDEYRYADFDRDALLNILTETEKLSNVGGWEWDIVKDLWNFSDNWLRIHGFSKRNLTTSELLSIAHPDDRQDIQNAFNSAVIERTNYEIEHRIIRQDTGEERYIRSFGKPKLDSEGKVVKLYGSAQEITEQKKAEETLHQSNEMFKRTEAIANVGSWEWEIETDTVTWSEELYRIFQLDPDGEAPKWAEHPKLLHPEDSEKLRQAAEKAIADGKPYEIELRAIRKDGKIRICKSKGFAQIGIDGQVVRLFGLLQDITDKKLVENALLETENEFRNLFESTPIATFVWRCKDSEIILRDINDAAILMTHGKGEQFIGRSIDQIYPDRPDMLNNFKVCLTSKKNIVYETEYVTRGTDLERFIVFTFVYISDELLMLHADDVTERKEAEKAMEESEERYNLAMDASRDGVYEWDLETREIYFSPGWKRMLGYEPDELPDDFSVWEKLTRPEDVEKSWQMMKELIEGKRERFEVEFEMRHKDGHWVHILSRSNIYKDATGKRVRVVGTHVDITDSIQQRERLRLSESRYRKAQELGKVGNWEYNLETAEFWGSDEAKKIFELDPDKDSFTIEDVESCIIERESVHQALVDLIENGKPYNLEYDIITKKNGKRKTFVSIAEIETNGAKNPVKVSGVIHDITDRKQADEKLKKSEARHGKMLANIGDVIVIIDQDGINRYKSPNIEKLFGWKPEEVVGATTWDNVHPDDIEPARKFFERMMHKPDVIGTMECRYRCKYGNYKWIEFTGINLFHDPDIQGLLGNYQDITERKQAEKLLIKNEALFRGLFDNMTSGSAVYEVRNDGTKGKDYIIREFNRKSLEMEGKKLEEVKGRSLFDLRPSIDDYGLIPTMKKVWETGVSEYFPIKIYQDEKFSNYYENHIFKLPSGEVVTIYNDVTDQKNQENALQDSEEMYRTTFDAIPDSITVTRQKDGRYNYVNDGFCNITGYSRAEVIGKTPFDINLYVNPSDRERMVQTLRKNQELLNFEILFRRKNGTIFDSFFSARPVVIDGEDCLIALAKDVTEFKKAEEEKARLETQLNQAQKMESVGRLAGGVAHDFNNMLGVILGHVEFAVEKAEKNHDLSDDLNEIQKAAQRSANLTKQLLTFARKDIISPKRIDLNDTVESMLNMLRRLIGEDIDLVWRPTSHLWPVKMDPTQIDQILANLCINARDAISGVGKLTIKTGIKSFDEQYCNQHVGLTPGDFVLLSVSDNGCGMDKETLDNLFEPFFTTKEVGKGTGLGLATIYGIIKQNNGFITVYSELGQGSTFNIYMPRFVTDENTEKDMSEKKAAAGGTETILLVEDEPSILKMTRMMLERHGYSVLSAATPAEAVEKAKNHSGTIDLLMTDVVMPEMNGRDLAGQIRELYPGIRLLFMSGYTADVIAHQGVLDDGVAFIQKPFSMTDMTTKVRDLLDKASDGTQV